MFLVPETRTFSKFHSLPLGQRGLGPADTNAHAGISKIHSHNNKDHTIPFKNQAAFRPWDPRTKRDKIVVGGAGAEPLKFQGWSEGPTPASPIRSLSPRVVGKRFWVCACRSLWPLTFARAACAYQPHRTTRPVWKPDKNRVAATQGLLLV